MIHKNRVNLGVIISGAPDQVYANKQQLSFLRRELKSFRIASYGMNKVGIRHLKQAFLRGELGIVLKNAYGRGNESDVERMLDSFGIPYLGSGARSTQVGSNKILTRRVLARARIPIVHGISFRAGRVSLGQAERILSRVGRPCVVKDPGGTDSRGLYLCVSPLEVRRALRKIAVRGSKVALIERYLNPAIELTCLVAGKKPRAYEPVRLVSPDTLFSHHAKDRQAYVCEIPAKVPTSVVDNIKRLAVNAHKALSCSGFSRADVLVVQGKPYFLEVDVHPGFRALSATTLSIEYAGESLDSFFLDRYAEAI